MIVALLATGSSLRSFADADQYDLIIGVNRAVVAHRCDWWVFGDDRTFMYAPLGSPRICVSDEAAWRLRDHDLVVLPWSSLAPCDPLTCNWQLYSVTAALMLCMYIGAQEVVTYGVDQIGVADFDGHEFAFGDETAAMARTPARWQLERELYQRVVPALKRDGVTVRRHDTPLGTPDVRAEYGCGRRALSANVIGKTN